MRFAFTALAATFLFASPALAGGDWDYGDDAGYGDEDGGYGGDYGAYYEGPAEYYAGFYPPRWARPRYYMPRAILPYEVYDRGGFRSGYAARLTQLRRRLRDQAQMAPRPLRREDRLRRLSQRAGPSSRDRFPIRCMISVSRKA